MGADTGGVKVGPFLNVFEGSLRRTSKASGPARKFNNVPVKGHERVDSSLNGREFLKTGSSRLNVVNVRVFNGVHDCPSYA
jgi:hypothetical protein